MSGIYIPNMQMPKSCGFCPLKMMAMEGDGCAIGARSTEYQKRPDDCPLVHDHGRLIDADALWESEKSADALYKLRPKGESIIFDAGFLAGYRAAAQIASKMPTIIPADKDCAE